MKAIYIKNLWFSYNGEPILKDVNLSIEKGDFLAIIGPNGGGKTTLLKLMLGLLTPDKGIIKILGKEPKIARHRISYLPQNTDINRGFPISVKDVVLMGLLGKKGIFKSYTKKDLKKAEEVLALFKMWDYRNRPIDELSGGQRQRVLLARAIISEPEILFLDEPTASIDTSTQSDIYEFLRELNKKTTIVIITHDVGAISRHIKSVACVNRSLVFHEGGKITREMLDATYECPIDFIAHGLPHRVFPDHDH